MCIKAFLYKLFSVLFVFYNFDFDCSKIRSSTCYNEKYTVPFQNNYSNNLCLKWKNRQNFSLFWDSDKVFVLCFFLKQKIFKKDTLEFDLHPLSSEQKSTKNKKVLFFFIVFSRDSYLKTISLFFLKCRRVFLQFCSDNCKFT